MTDARSLVRVLGDSKSPLYFVLIACIINIGVDFLLVGGFGLRAAGATSGRTASSPGKSRSSAHPSPCRMRWSTSRSS